ncbi:MAG: PH domain-containing protein [Halanaeroarchaeum sp.]
MPNEVPDWVTLTEGEQVVWRGGPATVRIAQELIGEAVLVVLGLWLAVAPPAALFGVALPTIPVVPLGLVGVGLVLAGVGVLSGVVTYLRFRAVEYLVTTEELYHKRGLLSRSVTNLRLERVQDSGFTQSAFQRLFDYGHVHVSTAGGGGVELRFADVDDPSAVNAVITEHLDRVRPE